MSIKIECVLIMGQTLSMQFGTTLSDRQRDTKLLFSGAAQFIRTGLSGSVCVLIDNKQLHFDITLQEHCGNANWQLLCTQHEGNLGIKVLLGILGGMRVWKSPLLFPLMDGWLDGRTGDVFQTRLFAPTLSTLRQQSTTDKIIAPAIIIKCRVPLHCY